MVRKKPAAENDRLTQAADRAHARFLRARPVQAESGVVEAWLQKIRRRMPEGSLLSATIHLRPDSGYIASFRLVREGEVLSSEARAGSADEAVRQAGEGLCQHLTPAGSPASLLEAG